MQEAAWARHYILEFRHSLTGAGAHIVMAEPGHMFSKPVSTTSTSATLLRTVRTKCTSFARDLHTNIQDAFNRAGVEIISLLIY